MDPAVREARAVRSFALYNNRYFAAVAEELFRISNAGADMVTTRMVASSSGLADSIVRPVLLRLVDAEILRKLPRSGAGRSPQYYLVVEPEVLQALTQLADKSDKSPTSTRR